MFSMCLLQVPVTVVSVSAIPKTGGCLESTVNATTESVTNTMASFAQVNYTLGTEYGDGKPLFKFERGVSFSEQQTPPPLYHIKWTPTVAEDFELDSLILTMQLYCLVIYSISIIMPHILLKTSG